MGSLDDEELRGLRAQIAALTAAVSALTSARAPAADPFVKDVADRYVKRVGKKYGRVLAKFLERFGERRCSELRKADYLAFRDDRAADGMAVGTLNQELTIVLAMFRWGVAAELVAANPFEGVRKLKGQRARETVIAPEAHAAAFADAPLLVRAYATACYETGARSGCEVLRIERAHIDEARGSIHFPRENTKGKRVARDVPMSDYLRDMLRALPVIVGNPYVFANPGTRGTYTARHLCRLCRPYLDRLEAAPGDGKVRNHDGRHSLVSRLVEGGVHPFASMKIVGHSSASMHWRYTHLSDGDRAKAKALLDGARKSSRR